MKTFKQFLVISLLFLSNLTKAQDSFLPDQIWYDTGKNIYVQLCLPSINTLDHFANSSRIFYPLLSDGAMRKMIQNYDRSKKISISLNWVSGEKKITDCDENISKCTIPSDLKPDSLSMYQELKVITREGVKINCYFKNMDDMLLFLKVDWEQSIHSIAKELNYLSYWDKRKAIFLHYRQNGDHIENTYKQWNLQVNNLDEVQIEGGAGINFFKGKFLPNFEGQLGLIWSHKGILKNHYFINLEMVYDFINENNTLVPKSQLFMDIGFKYNFSKTPNTNNWYGVSIGYLVKKNSSIFDDHTWRVSIYRKIHKNIEIVPQIFIPNKFSNVFPGLKVSVKF